jgi:hypothetical protein
MSDPFIDPTCSPAPINIPPLSAWNNPSSNINDFLCQLMQAAVTESLDPMLISPVEDDYAKLLDFSPLTAVGDHRFSDGAIIKAAFTEFLPKLVTQLEVKAQGGTKIINGFICDDDGVPKKQANAIPIMTTVGNGGLNIAGYDIPTGLDENKLMEPFTDTHVIDFVKNFISEKSQEQADAFIAYLQLHYPNADWDVSLHAFDLPSFFYVQLDYKPKDKVITSVYLKYHQEMKDYIAKKLVEIGYIPLNSSIQYSVKSFVENNAIMKIYIQPVPNYLKIIQDETGTLGLDAQLHAVDEYSVLPEEQFINKYTNLFELL